MAHNQLVRFSEENQKLTRVYYWCVIGSIVAVSILSVLIPAIFIWGLGAVFLTIVLPIWFLPIYLIWSDHNLGLAEQIIWIGLVVFASWLIWVLYVLFAPLLSRNVQHKPKRHL